MTTTLAKVKREYAASEAATLALLSAGQWGQDQATGRILAMRRDGVTSDRFIPYSEISTMFLTGTANTLQMATGTGLADTILSQSAGLLVQNYGQNGATLYSVQNTTSGTSSIAGFSMASNGGLGASLFLASSAYTDDTGCTSRLSLGTGSAGTGINLKGYNATDTIKTFFGSTYASGNLFHTLSNKGIKLENLILNTDADGTIAGHAATLTVTKNDGNTRQFYADKLVATLNPGGSNAATTLDLLYRDTVNTATTGLSVNLLNLKYGGSERLRLNSSGTLSLAGSSGNATLNVYGVGDSAATDSESLQIGHTGTNAVISAYKTGSGTYRSLKLYTSNTLRYEITAAGAHLFTGDATLTGALVVNPASGAPLAVKKGGTEFFGIDSAGNPNFFGSGTTAALTATLTNSPVTGNPFTWLNVNLAGGGSGYIPVWKP